MGSTRLPGKVLLNLPCESNIPSIMHTVNRVRKSDRIDELVVATTHSTRDDIILDLMLVNDVVVFRGSEDDVLSRYYHAAKKNEFDVVVRITADCPCVDYNIIDSMIDLHICSDADFTSNVFPRSFPKGFDIEIINFSSLCYVYEFAKTKSDREHVLTYVYKDGNKDRFNIQNYRALDDITRPEYRVVLDTKEDYINLCDIFDNLYENNNYFDVSEVVQLLDKRF